MKLRKMDMDIDEAVEVDLEAKRQLAVMRDAFAEMERDNAFMRETLQGILNADWRKWEELASPEEFVRWAKNRASHALTHNVKVTGGSDEK